MVDKKKEGKSNGLAARTRFESWHWWRFVIRVSDCADGGDCAPVTGSLVWSQSPMSARTECVWVGVGEGGCVECGVMVLLGRESLLLIIMMLREKSTISQ